MHMPRGRTLLWRIESSEFLHQALHRRHRVVAAPSLFDGLHVAAAGTAPMVIQSLAVAAAWAVAVLGES